MHYLLIATFALSCSLSIPPQKMLAWRDQQVVHGLALPNCGIILKLKARFKVKAGPAAKVLAIKPTP